MSSPRFASFSDAAAEFVGTRTAEKCVRYLLAQPVGARLDPRFLQAELGLDDDSVADLLDVAQRADIAVLEESPQIRCPHADCATRIDALALAQQRDDGDIPECPDCHQEVAGFEGIPQEMRYRFTQDAAAEVVAANELAGSRDERTAVLLCAIDDELDQLRRMLKEVGAEDLGYEPDLGGAVYLTTRFEGEHVNWRLHIAETGPTNTSAAVTAAIALAAKKPTLAFFIGIAGGVDPKDVKLGDVVVADRAVDYEVGKETKLGFQSRAMQERASEAALNWARALRGDPAWRERILVYKPALVEEVPDVKVGTIAVGSKVVTTTQTSLLPLIKSAAPKALAVEMEGSGFLSAAFKFPGTDALVVRGISDMLDEKEQSDDEGWRHQAAANAVAFVFELLSKYKPES